MPRRPGDVRRRRHVGVLGHPRGRVQTDPLSDSLRDRDRRSTPASGVFGIEGVPLSPAGLGVSAGAVLGDQCRCVNLRLPGELATPCDPSKQSKPSQRAD